MSNLRIYGYFTDPSQDTPAYDPGLGVDCPVCNHLLSRPVMTISLALKADEQNTVAVGTYSYFYRVHKACYEGLTDEEATNLDSVIIDAIASTKHVN